MANVVGGRPNWGASVELGRRLGSAATVLWSRQHKIHKIHKIQGTRNTTTPAHDNGFRVNQSDTPRSDVCRYTFSPLHRNEARHQQQRLEVRVTNAQEKSAVNSQGLTIVTSCQRIRPVDLPVGSGAALSLVWPCCCVPCLVQTLINHRLGHCAAWPQAYSSTSDTLDGGCQMTIRAAGE